MWIRKANGNDLEVMRDLLVETWHNTYDEIYGVEEVRRITTQWHSIEALKNRLAKPGSEFVVAGSGRNLAGLAFASTEDGNTVLLHQLYVRPRSQGSGLGQALLREIESCFPNARALCLEVEGANHRAIAFYKANGFTEVGKTENCGEPNSGIGALVFQKTLRRAPTSPHS